MFDLGSLNKEQSQAVQSRSQNTLVLAGAGTGKTKVLTSRIAFLIDLGVSPSEVFAVTFTNKAAKEMKDRISKAVPKGTNLSELWIGTFHGLCNKIIRDHHDYIDLPSNYQILDPEDQKSIIKRAIDEYELETNKTQDKKTLVNDSLNFISKAKEKGLRPDKSKKFSKSFKNGFVTQKIYEKYESIRISSNSIDYNDMILCVVELFDSNPTILNYYINKFKHLLVDEFQDTDELQYKLVKMIADKTNYLFVVGDDDQSIYGWRGAEVKNILGFSDEREDVEVIKLEQNYRSTKKILEAANAVIDNNEKRHGKNLWTDSDDGEDIKYYHAFSPEMEAEEISGLISKLIHMKKVDPEEIAILYRNNSISRSFEMSLQQRKIPYTIVGGVSFWARKEVKDLLSYLSLISDTSNNVSFERIVNVPTRGVGKKALEKIRNKSSEENISMYQALTNMLESKEIKGKGGVALTSFINLIETIRNSDISSSIYYSIIKIIEETDIVSQYKKEGEEKYEERKLNMQELAYAGKNFVRSEDDDERLSDIEIFISQAALQNSQDKSDKNKVSLMTTHASKGLEFPYVFLVGFEHGIFPSSRAINFGDIEEERRLAYVAITRAEKELTVSHSGSRYGKPSYESIFVKEMKEASSKSDSENVSYRVGEAYDHEKYGAGEIINIESDFISTTLLVDFGFFGRKSIMIKK